MGKGRGGGKTPERITDLLKKAVAEKSQSAVARESGLALLTVQRYLKGIGEPTEATIQKLSDYFGVTVGWLRGSDEDDVLLDKILDEVVLVLNDYAPKEGDIEGVVELNIKLTDFIKKLVLYNFGVLASADEKTIKKVNDIVEKGICDFVAKVRATAPEKKDQK